MKLQNSQLGVAWNGVKGMVFPSPMGSSYFSILRTAYNANFERFPSPEGSSYFSIAELTKFESRRPSFPSPAGSSYFSIKERYELQGASGTDVSVPYGVFVFLNDTYTACYVSRCVGFRLLRGLRISQWHGTY